MKQKTINKELEIEIDFFDERIILNKLDDIAKRLTKIETNLFSLDCKVGSINYSRVLIQNALEENREEIGKLLMNHWGSVIKYISTRYEKETPTT